MTFNGVTTSQTTTFEVVGSPSVEVFDVFATDANGTALSLEDGPQVSKVSDAQSEAISTEYDAGDPIQLYIDVYNDVAEGESAYFEWYVLDPYFRTMPGMGWSGDLPNWLGRSWWLLPTTIPTNAVTGTYYFYGQITYNDRTTYQYFTFHVNGPAGPANDNISTPTVISSVPYFTQQDTWGATTATGDPSPSCGSGSGRSPNA